MVVRALVRSGERLLLLDEKRVIRAYRRAPEGCRFEPTEAALAFEEAPRQLSASVDGRVFVGSSLLTGSELRVENAAPTRCGAAQAALTVDATGTTVGALERGVFTVFTLQNSQCPPTGTAQKVEPLSSVSALAPAPGGGFWLGGPTADGAAAVLSVGGAVRQVLRVPHAPRRMAALGSGTLGSGALGSTAVAAAFDDAHLWLGDGAGQRTIELDDAALVGASRAAKVNALVAWGSSVLVALGTSPLEPAGSTSAALTLVELYAPSPLSRP